MEIDAWKMVFGIILVVMLAGIAAVIVFGHVEEKDSIALTPVVVAVSSALGAFGNWAFSNRNGGK